MINFLGGKMAGVHLHSILSNIKKYKKMVMLTGLDK